MNNDEWLSGELWIYIMGPRQSRGKGRGDHGLSVHHVTRTLGLGFWLPLEMSCECLILLIDIISFN